MSLVLFFWGHWLVQLAGWEELLLVGSGLVLLVSDVPLTPEGVKTKESDVKATKRWSDIHLQIGIEAMTEIGAKGEQIKHFRY